MICPHSYNVLEEVRKTDHSRLIVSSNFKNNTAGRSLLIFHIHVACSDPSPYLPPQTTTLRISHMTGRLVMSQQITRPLHTEKAWQGRSPGKLFPGRFRKENFSLPFPVRSRWGGTGGVDEGDGLDGLREAGKNSASSLHYGNHRRTVKKLKLMQNMLLIKAHWQHELDCSAT